MRPRILLVSTGGTLGMLGGDPGPLAPSHVADNVLPFIKGIEAEVELVPESLCNLDSSDLGPAHWQALARLLADRLPGCDGAVVMHGTDTMAWTASALSFMLQGLPRPVVLTGAQRPVSFARSDARTNLIHSALCAAMPIPEVCIWFGRWLFRGNRATKTSIQSYEAFESPDLPPLLEMGVEVRPITPPLPARGPLRLRDAIDPAVAIVPVVPGSDGDTLRAVADSGVHGVVVTGFGSGNVPRAGWPDAIDATVAAGIPVVMHSQCARGTVRLGAYEGGKAALGAGAIGSGAMTVEASTVKLMWALGQGFRGEALRVCYGADLAGEGAGSDAPQADTPPGEA